MGNYIHPISIMLLKRSNNRKLQDKNQFLTILFQIAHLCQPFLFMQGTVDEQFSQDFLDDFCRAFKSHVHFTTI